MILQLFAVTKAVESLNFYVGNQHFIAAELFKGRNWHIFSRKNKQT